MEKNSTEFKLEVVQNFLAGGDEHVLAPAWGCAQRQPSCLCGARSADGCIAGAAPGGDTAWQGQPARAGCLDGRQGASGGCGARRKHHDPRGRKRSRRALWLRSPLPSSYVNLKHADNARPQSLHSRPLATRRRLQTACNMSGFAAEWQPPPEPALRHPARRLTAAPSAVATQQRWTAQCIERLLPAKVNSSSRPSADLAADALIAPKKPVSTGSRCLKAIAQAAHRGDQRHQHQFHVALAFALQPSAGLDAVEVAVEVQL